MRLFSRTSRLDADLYAARVLELLSSVFDQLREDPVRAVVLSAVRRQVAEPGVCFEVILDDPMAANWRLGRHPELLGALRVADCRLFGTAPRPDVDAINEQLVALDGELRGSRN